MAVCVDNNISMDEHEESKEFAANNTNAIHIWQGRKMPVLSAMSMSNGTHTSSTSATDKGCWVVGIVNSGKKGYLSAETFGFRVNANGKSLKKKQLWTLEPFGDGENVALRSHLDKYLAVDQFGNVTCDQDEKEDASRLEISVCDDFSGRWAFRSVTRGYFLGASGDAIECVSKTPSDSDLWFVHLAARPQINLKSVGRKRFAHLDESGEEVHVDAIMAWGEDTLFTLEFREESNKYAIHTSNNRYLRSDGKLLLSLDAMCYFSCEYHAGHLALRDPKGLYLAPVGSRAVLKTRAQTVTKDELFALEDSLPQANFVARANNRFISVKQGVDVTANQDEISDHETFQLEHEAKGGQWYLRTMQDKYFALHNDGAIQASDNKRSSSGLFTLKWHSDGSISLLASNQKFVGTKRSGHLYANCDSDTESNTRFFFHLANRPVLVLRCEQGFVGYKTNASTKLECNKANYETIRVERGQQGRVLLRGQNGKLLQLGGEGLVADGDSENSAQAFYLELRDPTRMCIKTEEGKYVNSEKNGAINAKNDSQEQATLWEY